MAENAAGGRGGDVAPQPSASRRRDIQGLRAIAVAIVVAFHAGLPIPGGFVGVDVFFVISGFVITGMLRREWLEFGRVKLVRFYTRRFLRLTPALALTVSVTLTLSFLVLSPFGGIQTAAKTGVGAILLSANGVIFLTTGGYFDAPAAANPLLNTWSLSVEEQFYVVFPALLIAGWIVQKAARALWVTPYVVVGLVAAVSFSGVLLHGAGFVVPGADFLLGFYGPVGRAWEFALGALLALVIPRMALPFAVARLGLSAFGIALLLASCFWINESTPFPGPWTLLPVVGTLLLLFSGALGSDFVTGVLSSRPAVRFGDWSYSIYLWHWPLIVFAVYLWPKAEHVALIAAVLALAPALASYHWIEQPLRGLRGLSRTRLSVLIMVVVLPPLLIAVLVDQGAQRLWLPRYASGAIPVVNSGNTNEDSAFFDYLTSRTYPCALTTARDRGLSWRDQPNSDVVSCRQSLPGNDVEIAVLGDSHAWYLFPGFADSLPKTNVAYFIGNGLPSSSGADANRVVSAIARDKRIRVVLVAAYWGKPGHVSMGGLRDSLRTLRSAGKVVAVTDDVPDFPFDALRCKFRIVPWLPYSDCSESKMSFMQRRQAFLSELETAVRSVPGTSLVRTSGYFCGRATCDMARGGSLLYSDGNHLNLNGARFLAEEILKMVPNFEQRTARSD